jgi:hypothetical protein
MEHAKRSSRGRLTLLVVVVGAAALVLVLAAAAFAAAPTVTITGPQYYTVSPTPSASPTAAAPAIHYPYADLYLADNGWGITDYRLSNDGGATWSDPASTFNPLYPWTEWWLFDNDSDPAKTLDGPHTVTAQFSNDGGATWGATSSATTLLDTQEPIVKALEGYWNNNYPYKLTARDQLNLAGVQNVWYSIDAGPLVTVTNSQPLGAKAPMVVTFDLPGETGTEHDVGYAAMDYAGNFSFGNAVAGAKLLTPRAMGRWGYLYTAYLTIDRTAPTIKARGVGSGWHYGGPVNVRFSASDADAGVDFIQYSITGKKATVPGTWTTGNSVLVTSYGKHKVWYQAVDSAQPEGNASEPAWVLVKMHR